MNSPEIEELKRLVKEKYEDTLATSTDFEVFSLMLKKKYNATVSTSTLCWRAILVMPTTLSLWHG